MTDLSRFRLGISSDGDVDLDCLECFGSMTGVDPASTLAELIALAEAHRCAVVVEGGGRELELPRASDVAGR